MRFLLVMFVGACVAGVPSPNDNQDPDTEETVDEWKIETRTCVERDLHVWLPLGSAWASVRQVDGHCEILIGGETENPMYGGEPSQRCAVPRTITHVVTIDFGDGGPGYANDPYCVDL